MLRSSAALLLLSIPYFLFPSTDPMSTSEGQLASSKKVGPLRIEQSGMYSAIADISRRTGVPVGLDERSPLNPPSIIVNFAGGIAKDLFDQLVSAAPNYEWQEDSDGFVYVSRRDQHNPLLSQVIDFPGVNGETPWEVWSDMPKWTSLNEQLRAQGCSLTQVVPNKEFRTKTDRISIGPEHVSLRLLLDQIALQSGTKRWAVLESATQSGSCEVEIRFW